MSTLSYTVVIATYKRIDSLSLSLPLLLEQTRKPAQIIIVDSSPDHTPVSSLVREATENCDIEIFTIKSEKGLTKQRNKALKFMGLPENQWVKNEYSGFHSPTLRASPMSA